MHSLLLALFVVTQPAPAPPPSGPLLFTLEEASKGSFLARVHNIGSGNSVTIFDAPSLPEHVLWSRAKKRVVYVADGAVWLRDLANAKAKATSLGKIPASGVERLWIEDDGKGARNIRAITLVPVPDSAVKRTGDKVSYSFEGKSVPADGVSPFGTPMMALLLELDGKGAWKRISATPTSGEAADTLGASVLEGAMKPAADVVRVAARVAPGCTGATIDCAAEGNAKVAKLVGACDEGCGVLRRGDDIVLAFSVAMGDTPHPVPPLFLCEKGCAKGKKLDVAHSQMGLAVEENFILVTGEFSGEAPVVFNTEGKKVLEVPGARVAVWLPD